MLGLFAVRANIAATNVTDQPLMRNELFPILDTIVWMNSRCFIRASSNGAGLLVSVIYLPTRTKPRRRVPNTGPTKADDDESRMNLQQFLYPLMRTPTSMQSREQGRSA